MFYVTWRAALSDVMITQLWNKPYFLGLEIANLIGVVLSEITVHGSVEVAVPRCPRSTAQTAQEYTALTSPK